MKTNKELNEIISVVRSKAGLEYEDYDNYDAMKFLSNILDSIFVRMNIGNEAKKILDDEQLEITNHMSESEIKAYKLGIENMLSVINSIIDAEEDNFIMLTNTDDEVSEFTLGDIISVIADEDDK